MNILLLFILVISAPIICAEELQDGSFKYRVKRNIVYANDIPSLHKKHMVSSLVSGLSSSPNGIAVLNFYQNASDLKNQSLRFDLYEPENDFVTNRPLIIVLHGGGFVAGDKSDASQQTVRYCDSLASRGFVVASVDYRMGLVLQSRRNELYVDSADFKRAVQWAAQDLNSAIGYFRANARKLKIDPNKIYVLGNSSGAIIALQNVYGNYENKANAAISLWGAVFNLNDVNKAVSPILLVHGTEDSVVPFMHGETIRLDSLNENEIFPGYRVFLSSFNAHFDSPVFYGSGAIDSVLSYNGIAHETLFVDGGKHELYNEKVYENLVWNKIFNFLDSLTSIR